MEIAGSLSRPIETAQIDAENVEALTELIRRCRADLVINVALPYQDLAIMEACLAAGAHYLDTANYEPRAMSPSSSISGSGPIACPLRGGGADGGVLGCGFDPGVTNVFCAYALRREFDHIETIDILDCNAGNHGLPFATNFNPEINLREVTSVGRYYEGGKWHETAPLALTKQFDFPEVGVRKVHLLYHEELESLALHLPGVQRLRFWMTFSDSYLTHLQVLQNVGLTRIDPIRFQGQSIIPLEFLKALLPDPATLGSRTKGKTCIGCLITGTREGRAKRTFTWNVCDHERALRETGAQAIAYTTGVPAALGARLILTGAWRRPGVFNIDQRAPLPFMEALGPAGLRWESREWQGDVV